VGAGDREDKMSIALEDGAIQVRVRLGSGSLDVQLSSPHSNVRYDDGQWHRLVVSRHAREVSALIFSRPTLSLMCGSVV